MPFPWKQGDEADEDVTVFSPEERAMTGDAQDAEYLEPLHALLAEQLASAWPPEREDEWATAVLESLTEKGWRFVTAKDWRAMCDAWVMQAIR